MGSRDRDLPARLLQVQPVDLPADVRARSRLPQALDGQLVRGRQDGSGQRAGGRRRMLAVRDAGGHARSRTVVLPHHAVCRRAPRRAEHAPRVAGESRRHAAELDRAFRRSADQVPGRGHAGPHRNLHDEDRHDLRGDVRPARPRAPDGRCVRGGQPGSSRLPHAAGSVSRARSRGAADRRDREGRVRHRQEGDQPVHERRGPDLDRQFRPRRVRHRGDHGGPGARSARLRVRPQVRPHDPGGRRVRSIGPGAARSGAAD